MNEYDEKYANMMSVFPGAKVNDLEQKFAEGAVQMISGGYNGDHLTKLSVTRGLLQVSPEGDAIEVLTLNVGYADFAVRPVAILVSEGFNGLLHITTNAEPAEEVSAVITTPTEEEVAAVAAAREKFVDAATEAFLKDVLGTE